MIKALVPAAATNAERPTVRPHHRPDASFVAHLIATAARLPQTRERRRAEPEQAIAAYAALGQWPTEVGRALSRSL